MKQNRELCQPPQPPSSTHRNIQRSEGANRQRGERKKKRERDGEKDRERERER